MRRHPATRVISLVIVVCFSTVSCATMAENPALCTAAGAVIGGGLGALIGGVAGGGRGAAIGAGAGGVAGAFLAAGYCFKLGPFASREVKGYEETRAAANYQPSQGDVVQITSYALDPGATAPGSQVALNATYVVLAANRDQDVSLTETRILKVLDPANNTSRELGRVSTPVTVKPGTRQAAGKFAVPSGTPEGRYTVILEVAKDAQRDTKELPLLVSNDQAVLRGSSSGKVEVGAGSAKIGGTPASGSTRPGSGPPPVTSSPGGSLATLGERDPKAPPQVASVPAAGADTAKVTTSKSRYFVASKVSGKGNVREGPSTRFKVVGEIPTGARFLIVDDAKDPGGRWYKIRLDSGVEAWVAASLGIEVQE